MCIWHGAIDKAKKRLWWEMILDQLPAMDKLSEDGSSGKPHLPSFCDSFLCKKRY
jgi:hypothetical protein